MPLPHLILFEPDGLAGRLLAPLAADRRWRVRTPRTPAAALGYARDHRRPGVLVVRFDPADADAAAGLVGDVHRACPDVPVIAASDDKMADADRAAWTATLFDLGARAVLFPPLSRPALEEVVTALMGAAVRRAGGDPDRLPAADEVIDLADEDG